ncbi:hypothetical protein LCGC14_2520280, partial [marine sediment metagenome]
FKSILGSDTLAFAPLLVILLRNSGIMSSYHNHILESRENVENRQHPHFAPSKDDDERVGPDCPHFIYNGHSEHAPQAHPENLRSVDPRSPHVTHRGTSDRPIFRPIEPPGFGLGCPQSA